MVSWPSSIPGHSTGSPSSSGRGRGRITEGDAPHKRGGSVRVEHLQEEGEAMRAFARIALVVVILSLAIPPAAGQAAEFTFRVGVMNVAGHPGDLGAKLFAKNIEKASNGRIKVEVFPGGVLGTENAMWEAMKVGTVDLATIAPGNMGRFVPEMSIMSLPFLFKDFDHLFQIGRASCRE